jgi:hypothetical protein
MTKEEIIELARQAGCPMANMMPMYFTDTQLLVMLETFAKLVAEKEREACAKEADKRLHDYTMLTSNPPQSGAAWSIASAIRARGSV